VNILEKMRELKENQFLSFNVFPFASSPLIATRQFFGAEQTKARRCDALTA